MRSWHHASGNAEDAGDASADGTLRQMIAKDCQGSLSRVKAEGSSPSLLILADALCPSGPFKDDIIIRRPGGAQLLHVPILSSFIGAHRMESTHILGIVQAVLHIHACFVSNTYFYS